MRQVSGCGSRRRAMLSRLLPSAILAALAGNAAAVDPRLSISGAAAPIDLKEVRYTPGTKLLYARSLAGNFDCGTASAPAAGSMQLDLDGNRYEILVPTSGAPINYAPGMANFTFGLSGAIGGNCKSSGATVMDFVMMGADGQPTARSRIGQTVRAMLPTTLEPTVALDITLMDPIRCESFGINADGIDAMLTDVNTVQTGLTGIDHIEYRLAEVNGRRELQVYPRVAPSGVQRVQCTSPGLALGSGGAGAVPGQVFSSAFEPSEAAADIGLTLSSSSLIGEDVKFVVGGDGARIQLTLVNGGRSDAVGLKVREYLRGALDPALLHVVAGTDAISCTPIPVAATANCPSFGTASAVAFPLSFDLPSLAPGQGLQLTLHRQLQVPSGTASGASVEVGYAAFVDPAPLTGAADYSLGNNAKWVDFAVS